MTLFMGLKLSFLLHYSFFKLGIFIESLEKSAWLLLNIQEIWNCNAKKHQAELNTTVGH